jgi:hypothetical protein
VSFARLLLLLDSNTVSSTSLPSSSRSTRTRGTVTVPVRALYCVDASTLGSKAPTAPTGTAGALAASVDEHLQALHIAVPLVLAYGADSHGQDLFRRVGNEEVARVGQSPRAPLRRRQDLLRVQPRGRPLQWCFLGGRAVPLAGDARVAVGRTWLSATLPEPWAARRRSSSSRCIHFPPEPSRRRMTSSPGEVPVAQPMVHR